MKVAAIQHDIVWADATATRALVTPMIAQAAEAGARLIVLSEMFATGFTMRPDRLAEDEGGPNEQFLLARAAEHEAVVIASIAQRGADGRFRNNAVVAWPDGTVERYAKIHPFSYAGEHERYAAGDKPLTVDVFGLRTSVFVCYDLRFADEFWPLAPHTDLYVVPANWPTPREAHWSALLRARAIENQAYVVGVNRVGPAGDTPHTGASAILDPMGRALAEGGDQPSVLLAEVSADTVRDVRARFPFIADRR
ncbi:nitrilase-related carbon-nitrogen hydrolase [uncultured Jatrophihabitans sp.]|uniref:nitrilase-related carbon-nitrogen hydrolase n=1 Tax=uncultured Jatrophihabitans sp. TaxID=1610747 RepID=UPI0035CC7CDC